MGIGYALASGLVQGFTQNIGREMERRKAEKDRLTTYKAALTEALLKDPDDVNAAGIKALQGMVQRAEGQLDERESINIFGKKGTEIDLDMDNDFDDVIAAINSSKTKEGMITKNIAGYEFFVPEKYSEVVGKPQADAILFQAFGEDVLANKQKFEGYVRESGKRDEMVSEINRLAKRSLVQASTGSGEAAQAGQIRVGLSELVGYDYLNDFLNIDAGQQFQVQTEAFLESEEAANAYGDTLLSPNILVVPGSIRGLKDTTGADLDFSLFQPSDNEYSAITRAAEVQGMDASYFFHEYAKDFDDVDDLKIGVRGLTKAFELGAGKEALSSEELYNLGEFLVNDPDLQNNLIMQARVIEPFRPLFVDKIEQQLVASGVTNDIYFSNKPFDQQFKALYGYSREQFNERMDAFRNAKQKLRQYRSLVAQKGTTSGGLVEYLTRTMGALFGETGTIDQLLNFVGLSGTDREREREYLLGLSKGSNKLTAISQADTLRYIIAADLARAEDSAGRLSDGDILRNLNKLTGFGNQNLEMELASVDQVITDLDRQFSNLTVLDQIAGRKTGKTSLSYSERRLLIADNVAGLARDEYLVRSGQRTSGALSPPIPPLEDILKMDPLEENVTIELQSGESLAVESIRIQTTPSGTEYYAVLPGDKRRKITADEAASAVSTGQAAVVAPQDSAAAEPAVGIAGSTAFVGGENEAPTATVTKTGGGADAAFSTESEAESSPTPAAPAAVAMPDTISMTDMTTKYGKSGTETTVSIEGDDGKTYVYQYDLTKKAYVRQ